MLRRIKVDGGIIVLSDAARDSIKFPEDDDIGQIVRSICPASGVEVTQRHPVSLILKCTPEMAEADQERLVQRVDERVSRTQF